MPAQDGAHQPFQSFGRGRLHALVPASFARRRQHPVWPALKGEHLAIQPAAERLGVVQRGLSEPERPADLGAVVFDGPAVPVVALPGSRGDADLARYGLDCGNGHVLGTAREAALHCEQLEQHGEAQARGAGLVADQRTVRRAQRPAIIDVADLPRGMLTLVSHSASLAAGRC